MSTAGGQVIIGATSEIVRATALELARAGGKFVIAGRDAEELSVVAEDLRVRTAATVTVIPLDVTAYDTHAAFFDACVAALGTIEGVVVGQGFMADQQQAASDWSLAHQMIEVNYTSAVSLINLFAVHLVTQGHGYHLRYQFGGRRPWATKQFPLRLDEGRVLHLFGWAAKSTLPPRGRGHHRETWLRGYFHDMGPARLAIAAGGNAGASREGRRQGDPRAKKHCLYAVVLVNHHAGDSPHS